MNGRKSKYKMATICISEESKTNGKFLKSNNINDNNNIYNNSH